MYVDERKLGRIMASQLPKRYFGALRDKPDHRDLRFSPEQIPTDPTVDLREFVPKVLPYQQGELRSCTANAVAAAFGLDIQRQGLYYFQPSRLFLYYNTREIMKKTQVDRGASLRDTLKSLNRNGVCPETPQQACDSESGSGYRKSLPYWPYDTKKFACKPTTECYSTAQRNIVCKYERIFPQDIHHLRACLKAGFPFVFGFEVFPSFEDTATFGVMKMPSQEEISRPSVSKDRSFHAVVAVGYDDKNKIIIVLNSWGSHWGKDGYFDMPYEFITNSQYCFDFWKIEFVCEDPDLADMPHCKNTKKGKATKKELVSKDPELADVPHHKTTEKARTTSRSKVCMII